MLTLKRTRSASLVVAQFRKMFSLFYVWRAKVAETGSLASASSLYSTANTYNKYKPEAPASEHPKDVFPRKMTHPLFIHTSIGATSKSASECIYCVFDAGNFAPGKRSGCTRRRFELILAWPLLAFPFRPFRRSVVLLSSSHCRAFQQPEYRQQALPYYHPW